MQTPVQEEATVKQLGYSLSPLAKLVMAVFTMVIVAMLALICVNTQAINQKTIRIKNLEQQREELMEEHEDVQRRIADAKSEETIREYAQSQGMVQGAQ
jgi:cell division protein FtsL